MIPTTAQNKVEAIDIINQRIREGGRYHISLALSMIEEFNLASEYEIDLDAYCWNDRLKFKKSDNRHTNFSDEEGVYLLGETAVNPHTNEQFYYLKVGRGINLRKRVEQYKTYSPTTWHIDSFNTINSVEVEKKCHFLLKTIGKQTKNTEWFEVSKNTYLDICDKGFCFFFHHSLWALAR